MFYARRSKDDPIKVLTIQLQSLGITERFLNWLMYRRKDNKKMSELTY